MNATHYNIIRTHKKLGYYGQTRVSKNFKALSVNGVSLITTDKNYFIDSKTLKPKFNTMTTDNASYNSIVDIYAEILPGLFFYMSIATEDNITEKLESIALYVNNYDDVQLKEIEKIKDNLKFY